MNAVLISDELNAKARAFTQRPRELLIGGSWRPAHSGETFEVIDPANGEVFAHAAAGDAADIDDAGKAARELGWTPRTALDDGLGQTWTWFQANRP